MTDTYKDKYIVLVGEQVMELHKHISKLQDDIIGVLNTQIELLKRLNSMDEAIEELQEVKCL